MLTFGSIVLSVGRVSQHKVNEGRAMVGILLSKDGGQGGQRELLSFFLMECLVREEEIKGT